MNCCSGTCWPSTAIIRLRGSAVPHCFAAAIAFASCVVTIVPRMSTLGTPSLSSAGAAMDRVA